jgi:hypothetical protein
MMSRCPQQFVQLAVLMLVCLPAQATWYDYAFAETSGQKDAEGISILKPDGTPLPNLPAGLTRATTTLDSSGNLYAAYFLEIEKDIVNPDRTITKRLVPHLTWIQWSKNVWKEQTATLHTGVTSPQVAVDSMGNAFLFYLNNGNLEYAVWSDANQSFDPTKTAIYTDEYVAQVNYDSVNQKSRPQVTYLDKGSVKHAFIFPETESESVIEVKAGVFSSLSMAIDANGSPHILYHDLGEDTNRNGKLDSNEDVDGDSEFDEGSRNLKYATYDSALQGFVRYTLAAGHEAGSQNSIAISATGNIHACYYDAKRLELRYLKRNLSGLWENPQTVDNNWVNGGLNHLATDANGNVHISYLGYYGYNVKYATNRTGSWTNEIIQTTNEQDHFRGTAIAADKDGHPHILTIENETNYLHYITTTTDKVPLVDSDNDGATDLEEKLLDTDPLHPDSDGDGLTDGEEKVLETDPNKIDSDGDGLTDAKEEKLGLNPNGENSDEDFAQALDAHRGYPRRTFKTSPYTEGWFYTTDMGWLYTSPDFFPYIYKPDEGTWFFFQEGTSAPRWFFNTKTGAWDQR